MESVKDKCFMPRTGFLKCIIYLPFNQLISCFSLRYVLFVMVTLFFSILVCVVDEVLTSERYIMFIFIAACFYV